MRKGKKCKNRLNYKFKKKKINYRLSNNKRI